PVDVLGCDMAVSPKKPAIGAPIAAASSAVVKSLVVFIDECLLKSGSMSRACTEDGARRMPAPSSKCQVALRSGLNAARISSTNSFGCSQAAKCVPLGNVL